MNYTNKFNLPQSFVDVVENLTWDIRKSDPKRFGVTSLISAPRPLQLRLRHWDKIEEDVSDQLWRILGESVHYVMAKGSSDNRLVEEKLTEEIHGITLVAKPDIYDGTTKSIEDWKVTSVFAVKGDLKKEWSAQLNLYAWLLEKHGFEVKTMSINAILRDWSATELKRYGGEYPLCPFKKIQVPIWSKEEQEKLLEDRIKLHLECAELTDIELPVCSPEERWASEPKFAVYKGTNKTAYRVFDDPTEAALKAQEMGAQYHVVERPGTDKKCLEYCSVCNYCSFYKEKYGQQ